jgi:hypothetical protein
MIQPGMMFGGEGPVMNGTWYNPHTGDAFTVRDSFFEDNQYVVTTTDGRYFRYDQLQNYIQSDMKLEDLKQMHETKENTNEILPLEVSNLIDKTDDEEDPIGILPDDLDLIKPRSLGNLGDKPTVANYVKDDVKLPVAPVNMNSAIIEKALKNTVKPNFSINVEWSNYPSKEIEMLKDIMEIPSDEIVEWYLDNIQFNDFIMAFKTAIDDKIRFGNKAENIEAKVIKLPEPEEVITIEAPVIDESHKDDGGALAKEPKKLGGPKTPRGGRKPVNKKK